MRLIDKVKGMFKEFKARWPTASFSRCPRRSKARSSRRVLHPQSDVKGDVKAVESVFFDLKAAKGDAKVVEGGVHRSQGGQRRVLQLQEVQGGWAKLQSGVG